MMGVSMLYGSSVGGEKEYTLVKRVARDTVPSRYEEIIKAVYKKGDGYTFRIKDVEKITRFPIATNQKLIQDLYLLNILRKMQAKNSFESSSIYELNPKFKELIQGSEIYN